MKREDLALIYHSGGERAVVGIAQITGSPYPDPDLKKPGEWLQVDLKPIQALKIPPGQRGDPSRSLDTPEGVGDRLRSAAFAEIQAREAFLWAARHYEDASFDLKNSWIQLSQAENRHLHWLLDRMTALKIEVRSRKVSDHLWRSLVTCKSAREFAVYMASAEERGRQAGVKFHQALKAHDPITAEIFKKIADEEVSHIALAEKHFPAH
ncbi:unnamed protein product [Sphagnum tenellum]